MYKAYAAAITFGSSSAVCEAFFSTLSCATCHVAPYRRSMTHQRESRFVVLAFLCKYSARQT